MNLTKPVQKPAMLNLKTVKGIHAVSKRGKGDVSPLTKSSSVRSRDLFDEDDESIVLSTTARVKAKSKQTREWVDVSSDEGGSRGTCYSLTVLFCSDAQRVQTPPPLSTHYLLLQQSTI